MNKIKFSHPALDQDLLVKAKAEVCPTCQGHGTHDRTDLDINSLLEDMAQDGDYAGIESYYSGEYSQRCDHCNGARVVWIPDEGQIPQSAWDLISDWNRSERQYQAEARAERMAGA